VEKKLHHTASTFSTFPTWSSKLLLPTSSIDKKELNVVRENLEREKKKNFQLLL
jgi:hypothetical protein